jgi:Tfp pilus assembly protein PilV
MLKLIFLKTKKNQQDQGFAMLEVIVAGLIAFLFIYGSLQAMVMATVMRVQALEKERANELIQEDKEAIQALASSFTVPAAANISSLCYPQSGDPATNGYAEQFRIAANIPYPVTNQPPVQTKQVLNSTTDTTKGRTIGLFRTGVTIGAYPYKALTINYQVQRVDASNNPVIDPNTNQPVIIATDTLEVVPNVALQCP